MMFTSARSTDRSNVRSLASCVTLAVVATLMPMLAGSANAQTGNVEQRCTADLTGPDKAYVDACQKIFDIFRFISPQIGVALVGGSTMLGESGTLGGPSNLSFSVRTTVLDGFIPNRDVNISPGGVSVSSNLGAKRAPIPMASADMAAGIVTGKPVGLTNVGGVDLLLGGTYVPRVNEDEFSMKSKGGGFAASYGVRVGILQESAAMPGLSVSYRNRRLPSTDLQFTPEDDTLRVKSASVNTTAIRAVLGKHYKWIGVAGGYGRDQINSKSFFEATIHSPGVPPEARALPSANDKYTRNNAFVNLSIGLPKAQLVGEMGWSQAGDVKETINTFENRKANEKYRYYTIALSFRP